MTEQPRDATDSAESRRARLRALLDGVDLDPAQTADDIALRNGHEVNRESVEQGNDAQLARDVPPHHVEHP